MDNKKILKELLKAFTINRRTGCTTAMLNGANETECVVIAHCENGKSVLKQAGYNGDSVSMYKLGDGWMKGRRKPIVMDNAAVIDTLYAAISAIEKQEGLVKRAKQIARQAARDIGEL